MDGCSTSISLQTTLCGCLTSAYHGWWVGVGRMTTGRGRRANDVPDGSRGSLMKFTITLAPAITSWGQMALYVIEQASSWQAHGCSSHAAGIKNAMMTWRYRLQPVSTTLLLRTDINTEKSTRTNALRSSLCSVFLNFWRKFRPYYGFFFCWWFFFTLSECHFVQKVNFSHLVLSTHA